MQVDGKHLWKKELAAIDVPHLLWLLGELSPNSKRCTWAHLLSLLDNILANTVSSVRKNCMLQMMITIVLNFLFDEG